MTGWERKKERGEGRRMKVGALVKLTPQPPRHANNNNNNNKQALTGLALFAIAHFSCGLILAVMFIVTHISEEAEFLHRTVEANDGKQGSETTTAAAAATSYASDEQKGDAPAPEATPEITGRTDLGHRFSARGNVEKAGVDDLAGVNNWAAIQVCLLALL